MNKKIKTFFQKASFLLIVTSFGSYDQEKSIIKLGDPPDHPDLIEILIGLINYFSIIGFILLLFFFIFNLYLFIKNEKIPLTKRSKAEIESNKKRYINRFKLSGILFVVLIILAIVINFILFRPPLTH